MVLRIEFCTIGRFLDLSGNHFSGTLPEAITNLTMMLDLELANNQFTGTLPRGLSQLIALGYGTRIACARVVESFGVHYSCANFPLRPGEQT